jgi:hypothetical protein
MTVFFNKINLFYFVRFEVLTAVTMKISFFGDVTPCGSWKNRRFGGTYRLRSVKRIRARNTLTIEAIRSP